MTIICNPEPEQTICPMVADISEISTKLDMLLEQSREMHSAIYGNGKPGLKMEVQSIGQRVNTMHHVAVWFLGTVGGVSITGTIYLLVHIVKHVYAIQ